MTKLYTILSKIIWKYTCFAKSEPQSTHFYKNTQIENFVRCLTFYNRNQSQTKFLEIITKFKQNNSFWRFQKMDFDVSKTNPRKIQTK